jgi:hypothetical protein
MDALDLLVDFVICLSTSAAVPSLTDGESNETYTVTTPSDSTPPHGGSLVAPVAQEQSCDPMTSRDRTSRQQNYPLIATPRSIPLAQSSHVHECRLEVQTTPEDTESRWSHGNYFEQYMDGCPGRMEASQNYLDHGHVPPWTNSYAFDSTPIDIRETWMPYPRCDGFYNAEEARLFVSPKYGQLYETPCRDGQCNCQTFVPPFHNTIINGCISIPYEAGFLFRGNHKGGMDDPWLSMTTTEDQPRWEWAQQ